MEIKEAIQRVVETKNLEENQARLVALEIMEGRATDAQITALLVGLRMKGETIEEIAGFVRAMREKSVKIKTESDDMVDTCGTGGDERGTFNISTASAFVAAGAGCRVAKHGNRSVSSQCGSADLLQELGVNIELSPEKVSECIDKVRMGFLFAPLFHKAMKYAIGPRKEIGIRTIFNVLGPLTNPAGTKKQVVGIFDETLTQPIARVLKDLGAESCMVVHGEDGLDEITTTGNTKISELKNNRIETYSIHPGDFGIKKASIQDLQGGDSKVSAAIILDIFRGKKGPKRDIVLLNAGAVIYVCGKASTMQEGIQMAAGSVDSSSALGVLEGLRSISQSQGP